MTQLDELITKLDNLYIPIYVRGKEYSGNNPFILNKINNMLEAGRIKKKYGSLIEPIETLDPDDLMFVDKRIHWFDENKDCVIYDDLCKVNEDICDEMNRLDIEAKLDSYAGPTNNSPPNPQG